ncbi:MAG: nitroreductase family protein [Candidatus Lokiarchaeota archaeon]|nr:nitroreductase family protein [Candidatus Lokiarchaeota archaeon]
MAESDQTKLLKERRSIRSYESKPIEDEILTKILETTRMCMSARNRQPWTFYVIKNKELIKKIAKECTTGPFASGAPLLIAIVGDKDLSPNWYLHDTCFVSLQLALAAWSYGIGTCWIGRINRENVKKLLNLKESDDLLTVLPLGYPKGEIPEPRPRKSLEEIVKYIE